MTFEELKEKALSLPYAPGVYIMRDKTDKVIYVGKAKKLKTASANISRTLPPTTKRPGPWCPRWTISTPFLSPRSSRP